MISGKHLTTDLFLGQVGAFLHWGSKLGLLHSAYSAIPRSVARIHIKPNVVREELSSKGNEIVDRFT